MQQLFYYHFLWAIPSEILIVALGSWPVDKFWCNSYSTITFCGRSQIEILLVALGTWPVRDPRFVDTFVPHFLVHFLFPKR